MDRRKTYAAVAVGVAQRDVGQSELRPRCHFSTISTNFLLDGVKRTFMTYLALDITQTETKCLERQYKICSATPAVLKFQTTVTYLGKSFHFFVCVFVCLFFP